MANKGIDIMTNLIEKCKQKVRAGNIYVRRSKVVRYN